jgi:hypothetical protein
VNGGKHNLTNYMLSIELKFTLEEIAAQGNLQESMSLLTTIFVDKSKKVREVNGTLLSAQYHYSVIKSDS